MTSSDQTAVGADALQQPYAQVSDRWEHLDRLLPVPGSIADGCGAVFSAANADGTVAAIASCTHWEGCLGELDMTWGAARRHELNFSIAGPDVSSGLDVILGQWREHLSAVRGAGGPDTAAVVTWPSRDVAGAVPLLRHSFAPLAVIAAQTAQTAKSAAGGAATRPPVDVRRAGPADLGAVVRLGLEVIRYDAYFGGVTERAWTAAALEREIAALLAAEVPWIWIAEQGGEPVGMLAAEPPGPADWIAPRTRLKPVAYLLLMGVRAGLRGHGIGAAMVAHLNEQVRVAGVPVTLLHYAQVNPLSAPFWSQQGYRPLWTCWEARPAAGRRSAPPST
jgi:GNAT superfamily N-acetyltransferase